MKISFPTKSTNKIFVLGKYKIYIDPIWELRCSQGSGCLYKDVRIVKETIFDNQVSDE